MRDGGSTRLAVAGAALIALEGFGTVLMWAPIPLAWLWIGGRVYTVTGSLGADLAVAFLGFVATVLHRPATRPCHRCGRKVALGRRVCRHCGYDFEPVRFTR